MGNEPLLIYQWHASEAIVNFWFLLSLIPQKNRRKFSSERCWETDCDKYITKDSFPFIEEFQNVIFDVTFPAETKYSFNFFGD